MEMALDGWKFLVLSPAYAIHWGFQEKNQQTKLRKMQVNKNRRRFNEFEKEVRAKYAAKNGKSAITDVANKKKNSKQDNKLKTLSVNNKNINLKTKEKPQHNSIKRIREFEPVTKPDFYEDDFAGPKFNDDII